MKSEEVAQNENGGLWGTFNAQHSTFNVEGRSKNENGGLKVEDGN
jgi:hypothetical protein